ncbi:hypothetical protein O0536_24785, partial [Brevibacillus laterosporus]
KQRSHIRRTFSAFLRYFFPTPEVFGGVVLREPPAGVLRVRICTQSLQIVTYSEATKGILTHIWRGL